MEKLLEDKSEMPGTSGKAKLGFHYSPASNYPVCDDFPAGWMDGTKRLRCVWIETLRASTFHVPT
jgi:hypothetical protein